jgi:hypothetical protein
MSSVNEIATCATVSSPRTRFFPAAVERPPSSLSAEAKLCFEPFPNESAGSSPKTRPVPTESRRAKSRTEESMPISAVRFVNRAANDVSSGSPHAASSTPSAPPPSESSVLSVNICLTSRPRLAPSAVRIAISGWRRRTRARLRFATFAHAMSSTSPVVASSIKNVGRACCVRASPKPATCAP